MDGVVDDDSDTDGVGVIEFVGVVVLEEVVVTLCDMLVDGVDVSEMLGVMDALGVLEVLDDSEILAVILMLGVGDKEILEVVEILGLVLFDGETARTQDESLSGQLLGLPFIILKTQ